MSGIYIHIPFCRQKCYYCDFYKTVNTSVTPIFLQSLKKEIEFKKNYLETEQVETIYFGGGTPSVLTSEEVNGILDILDKNFNVATNAEITFEANPDDLDPEYLKSLSEIGINRLSIGIQSFNDELLKKMNRRHNVVQAVESVKNAVSTGIENISVDLIYGIPGLSDAEWKRSLEQVFDLPVSHLSAYHLTYHEGTAFYTWLKKGTLKELKEEESVSQFNMLMTHTQQHGFEQYEISNFARNKMYSRHNTAYWLGKKYLGLGPSAHSFDGKSRSWNISSVEGYMNAIQNNRSFNEVETLNETDKYNEYILTRIRTIWGVSKKYMELSFGVEKLGYFLSNIEKYKRSGMAVQKGDVFTLSEKGLFISDDIMADLMII